VGRAGQTRSVFIFQAEDWEPARLRAIELGRSMEDSYLNESGERVSWRLVCVETLDLLGDDLLDGREVYSESVPLAGTMTTSPTRPEDSQPQQSGV